MQALGVLTLAHTQNDNYGAHLQAWALIQALRKIVASRPADSDPMAVGLVATEALEWYKCARNQSQMIMRYPTNDLVADKQRALLNFKHLGARYKVFEPFCRALQLRLPQETFNGVHGLNLSQMKFVVGSDWVWHFTETKPPQPAFLGLFPKFLDETGGVE